VRLGGAALAVLVLAAMAGCGGGFRSGPPPTQPLPKSSQVQGSPLQLRTVLTGRGVDSSCPAMSADPSPAEPSMLRDAYNPNLCWELSPALLTVVRAKAQPEHDASIGGALHLRVTLSNTDAAALDQIAAAHHGETFAWAIFGRVIAAPTLIGGGSGIVVLGPVNVAYQMSPQLASDVVAALNG